MVKTAGDIIREARAKVAKSGGDIHAVTKSIAQKEVSSRSSSSGGGSSTKTQQKTTASQTFQQMAETPYGAKTQKVNISQLKQPTYNVNTGVLTDREGYGTSISPDKVPEGTKIIRKEYTVSQSEYKKIKSGGAVSTPAFQQAEQAGTLKVVQDTPIKKVTGFLGIEDLGGREYLTALSLTPAVQAFGAGGKAVGYGGQRITTQAATSTGRAISAVAPSVAKSTAGRAAGKFLTSPLGQFSLFASTVYPVSKGAAAGTREAVALTQDEGAKMARSSPEFQPILQEVRSLRESEIKDRGVKEAEKILKLRQEKLQNEVNTLVPNLRQQGYSDIEIQQKVNELAANEEAKAIEQINKAVKAEGFTAQKTGAGNIEVKGSFFDPKAMIYELPAGELFFSKDKFKATAEEVLQSRGYKKGSKEYNNMLNAIVKERTARGAGELAGSIAAEIYGEASGQGILTSGLLKKPITTTSKKIAGQTAIRTALSTAPAGVLEATAGEVVTAQERQREIKPKNLLISGIFGAGTAGAFGGTRAYLGVKAPAAGKVFGGIINVMDPLELVGDVSVAGIKKAGNKLGIPTTTPVFTQTVSKSEMATLSAKIDKPQLPIKPPTFTDIIGKPSKGSITASGGSKPVGGGFSITPTSTKTKVSTATKTKVNIPTFTDIIGTKTTVKPTNLVKPSIPVKPNIPVPIEPVIPIPVKPNIPVPTNTEVPVFTDTKVGTFTTVPIPVVTPQIYAPPFIPPVFPMNGGRSGATNKRKGKRYFNELAVGRQLLGSLLSARTPAQLLPNTKHSKSNKKGKSKNRNNLNIFGEIPLINTRKLFF
jgi:hypothetical protein